jgi:urate oxidase
MASGSSGVYLSSNRYGKALVRLLKVTRKGEWHEAKELTVQVLLSGSGLDKSYYTGDNSAVVPTDTIKNVVHVLSKQHPLTDPESFGIHVAGFFLKEYSHIGKVSVEILDHPWVRMTVDGKPHQHSFVTGAPELRTVSVNQERGGKPEVTAGVKEVLILKTTGSGFEGFPRCKFTTLPEARDRLFKTKVTATWTFNKVDGVDFNGIYNGVKESIFKVGLGLFFDADLFSCIRLNFIMISSLKVLQLRKFPSPNATKKNVYKSIANFGTAG